MKTQLRISSLRVLAVSAIVAALFNITVIAQPNPDRTSLTLTSMERLEIFAGDFAKDLKYIAPDDRTIVMENEKAVANLELFADNTGTMLKYNAPVDFEDQINQEIETLASNMIGQLEYHAPVYDEFTNTFDKPVMSTLKPNTRPVIAEEVSSQEAWLINAGYYKSSGKALINKTKTEDSSEKYANKL